MDVARFIVESLIRLLDVITWPGVALIVLYLLEDPITRLMSSMSSLRYGDWEAQFERELNKAAEEADQRGLPTDEEELKNLDSGLDRISELVAVSPRAAIIQTWIQIEQATRELMESRGMDVPSHMSGIQVLDTLKHHGILTANELDIIGHLRHLRNEAAHVPDFSVTHETAGQYIRLAKRLIRRIRDLQQDADNGE